MFIPFILGFLVLTAIPFTQSVVIISLIVFISSLLTTVSLTTIRGIYADLIHEVPKEETDIEALGDFSTNIGYVLGPMTAGFLADKVGNAQSFAYLGAVGFVAVLVLYKFTKFENKISL
jgi:predicted MFS family arabinose efflux permease